MPDREVWAFGWQVTGSVKPYSDLDLVAPGDRPLRPVTRVALKDAFEESDLPFRVDVVEWATGSERFRQVILGGHGVLQSQPPAPR